MAVVLCVQRNMRVTMTLPDTTSIVLEVASSNTIVEIKTMTGLETDTHWLLCQGVKLFDTWTLDDYNVSDNFVFELQNIKEARKARKAAKKAIKGSSPVSSSDEEAPPPPGPAIPVSHRRKPAFAEWRNYQAELDAKEAERERSLNRLCGSLTGDYLDDVNTLMRLGVTESKAEMLALEMECAMTGVCDWCGRRGECPC